MPFSVHRRSKNVWVIKKPGKTVNKVFLSRKSAMATIRNYIRYNQARGKISHLKSVRRRRRRRIKKSGNGSKKKILKWC
jgi:hypothetical protein